MALPSDPQHHFICIHEKASPGTGTAGITSGPLSAVADISSIKSRWPPSVPCTSRLLSAATSVVKHATPIPLLVVVAAAGSLFAFGIDTGSPWGIAPYALGNFSVAFHNTREKISVSKMLAFTAAFQWHRAREAAKNIKWAFKKIYSDTTPLRPPEWKTIHGFYLCMGGLAFDTNHLGKFEKYLPNSRDQMVLGEDAVIFVVAVAPHLIPHLTEDDIKEKSKTDGMGKTIACLQAIRFSIQYLHRLIDGLSISLFELTAFAHAIFTLMTYFLWRRKPYDIQRPTIIRGEGVDDVCACLCMASTTGDSKSRWMREIDLYPNSDIPNLTEYTWCSWNCQIPHTCVVFSRTNKRWSTVQRYLDDGPLFARENQYPALDRFVRDELSKYYAESRSTSHKVFVPDTAPFGQLGVPRVNRTLRTCYPNRPDQLTLDFLRAQARQKGGGSLAWRIFTTSYNYADRRASTGLIFFGFIYSGLHLLAWSLPVPSYRQIWLWRASCLVIAAFAPIYFMICELIVPVPLLHEHRGRR
ncbi:hypothetical protein QBC44DRAFT_359536 [Cladorrhinum sp. PSN332]|nr:hypothetical protein QBC44DRAFT_359536 [Cladorrhinum sp. PSN332]